MNVDGIIRNVTLATMSDQIRQPYGQLPDAALVFHRGEILYAGSSAELPDHYTTDNEIDGHSGWVTPGLIDCHTHLVYGGDRAQEFEWRLQGQSYQEIAQKGGGIRSTVRATRNASERDLHSSAQDRLSALMSEGVTTVEIKSGYGLDLQHEMRMLQTARKLGAQNPVSVVTTFLGAHALPEEYQEQPDAYIDQVCEHMMPQIAASGLADAVDVFCESVGFSLLQTRKVFAKATSLGLKVKAHVEQLSYLGGARLAAEYNALSVDHIEYLPESELELLKSAGTMPVILPAAYYYLNETQKPPVSAMRNMGLPFAIASDLNPGTAPMASIRLAMNLSCVLFGVTPEEALAGVTRHAATALGFEDRGQLESGKRADFILWDINHPSELSYGINLVSPKVVWHYGVQR